MANEVEGKANGDAVTQGFIARRELSAATVKALLSYRQELVA